VIAAASIDTGSSSYRYFWGGPKACFLVVAAAIDTEEEYDMPATDPIYR